MTTNNCVVLIPIYKESFNAFEYTNIKVSTKNLVGYPIFWIAPEKLNINYYEQNFKEIKTLRFHDTFFGSVANYSRLLLDVQFYKFFENYTHILICQSDAIVLKPELHLWLKKEYDFIGAPWLNGWEMKLITDKIPISEGIVCRAHVGNGGLSLRNVKACIKLINEYPDIHLEWSKYGHAEDLFFSFTGFISREFRIPNLMVASHFSHETQPETMFKLIGNNLPFGIHGHDKYPNKHLTEFLKANT